MRYFALVVLAACGAHRRPLPCDKRIDGLPLGASHIVWFGEMHGTEESPRFVGDVACLAAQKGRVQLGLEIPNDEQGRIDHYLRSKGTARDRAELVGGTFWKQADGRSSEGMVALIERARTVRVAGGKLEIVAYDVPGAGRDEAMANEVAKRRDAGAIFVGLSGNVHSRRIKGTEWDPQLVPLVARLVAKKLPITTYNVSASGGTMWACIAAGPDEEPDCREHENHDNGGHGAAWTLGPPRDEAHDGVYFVGKTTASYPAKKSQ